MKTTIKIANADIKKLAVAGTVNNVIVKDRKKIGTDLSLVELQFKSPADLFETGRLINTVTGNELDAPEEAPKKADKSDKK